MTVRFKHGTADQWASINPVLLSGEPGIELDTMYFKVGDGITDWNSLPYQNRNTLYSVAGLTGNPSAAQIAEALAGTLNLADVVVTPQASTTISGLVELATPYEAVTGTDSTRAVTPVALKAVTDGLLNSIKDGAPAALDTLGELAALLASDESAVNALSAMIIGIRTLTDTTFAENIAASTRRTAQGVALVQALIFGA